MLNLRFKRITMNLKENTTISISYNAINKTFTGKIDNLEGDSIEVPLEERLINPIIEAYTEAAKKITYTRGKASKDIDSEFNLNNDLIELSYKLGHSEKDGIVSIQGTNKDRVINLSINAEQYQKIQEVTKQSFEKDLKNKNDAGLDDILDQIRKTISKDNIADFDRERTDIKKDLMPLYKTNKLEFKNNKSILTPIKRTVDTICAYTNIYRGYAMMAAHIVKNPNTYFLDNSAKIGSKLVAKGVKTLTTQTISDPSSNFATEALNISKSPTITKTIIKR